MSAGQVYLRPLGNPASTMVTFELFARAAVELLAGKRKHPEHAWHASLRLQTRQDS
jgi:molybdopterin biosynthesis enzyme